MIVACSKTPEERGKELAEKKIGLVKGIAEGLKATNAEPFSAPRPVQGVDEKKDTSANGVSVYLVASGATDSRLLLRAHNKQNQEIGRSLALAQIPAGSATYVYFAFGQRVKLSEAEYYTLAKAP